MNADPDKAVKEVALEFGINPAFVEKDWYVMQALSPLLITVMAGENIVL